MSINLSSASEWSNDQLLAEVVRLAGSERRATVALIAALAELDARRLYLGQGCASLFVYCTRVLRLSEHAAYGRIEAARAARRFPVLLEMLDRGELTLTSISLLAPHLQDGNYRDVLARAQHRSKREVEEMVAALRPRSDAPALLRKLPEARRRFADPSEAVSSATRARGDDAPAPVRTEHAAAGVPIAVSVSSSSSVVSAAPSAVPTIRPLAPGRYRLQVIITVETRDKLQRAQDLLRHSVPSGDLATVLDRAIDLLLADLQRRKVASVKRPRRSAGGKAGSRHIPAAVRRAVWSRDGGTCAFTAAGRRCGEAAFLEFHHRQPFADAGAATAENIELRCRAHNQYEAELFSPESFVLRERPAPLLWSQGEFRGLC
jgi:hypothetical protein